MLCVGPFNTHSTLVYSLSLSTPAFHYSSRPIVAHTPYTHLQHIIDVMLYHVHFNSISLGTACRFSLVDADDDYDDMTATKNRLIEWRKTFTWNDAINDAISYYSAVFGYKCFCILPAAAAADAIRHGFERSIRCQPLLNVPSEQMYAV